MCGPYGPRAPLRQQRRLEVDKSRKRDAQTTAPPPPPPPPPPLAPSAVERRTGAFFSEEASQ